MIGWFIDCVWAWRNREALEELNAESAALDTLQRRMDKRMEEEYGPDWRRQADERLNSLTYARWSSS